MTLNVLDSLSSIFGSQITRQASAFFGDSEESTRAGLRSSFSTVLAGLVQKCTIPGGEHDVFRAVTSDSVDPALNTRLASILDNRGSLDPALATGESVVSSIFGNRTGSIAHAVSEVAGLKPSSATGLLAMAAPMLLSVLKRQVMQGGLDARGLGSLLLNQRNALQSAGLDSRITNAMGFGSLQNMLGATEDGARTMGAKAAPRESKPAAFSTSMPVNPPQRRWLPWLVGAAVVALALAFLIPRFGAQRRAPMAATSLPASVYFDVGQAAVDDDDRRTIAVVASAVKGSDAPITVTGYTDQSGDPNQNLDLAKNRAAAVRDALVQEGVPASRVVMTPPTFVTGTGSADDARRVEITLAEAGTATRR